VFGGVGKRAFERTEISTTENAIGGLLLVLIAGIGMGIYVKGQHYDPNLFALDQSLLADQAPARQQVKLVEESAEGRVAGEEAVAVGMLQGLAPDGWRDLGPVESFTAETLYEKINGRAEQYLAYDVVGMDFVGLVATEGQFIDVFVYDMGGLANAFGIYAVERPEDARRLSLGDQGYRVESSFFFWKGSYYAQILASDVGPDMEASSEAIARAVEARLAAGQGEVWGLANLPEENREFVQYYKRDALSLDFLRETYTAKYSSDAGEWTSFVALHDSPQAAEETLEKYLAYLRDYGEVSDPRTVAGTRVFTGDFGGFYDVIFQRGNLFGGVNLAEGRQLAEDGADALLRAIE
jgi:hypothetical protein